MDFENYLNEKFEKCLETNDLKKIKSLFNQNKKHSFNVIYGIALAARSGNLELINFLIKEMKKLNIKTSKENITIGLASKYGHFDIVKLLLEETSFNPIGADNRPIQMAFENGHLNIVELLWSVEVVRKSEYSIKDSDLLKFIKSKKVQKKLKEF